ncbi:N-acetylmuramoyl-L-alanine amidase-like domain-containing protein [Francisella sp. 19X1-34]|uniref:N-acetylmuramoyl-L-alanine amidase-like domain-containing protein n=1 Tax=Francisella sp. 19X1-34 TaxID=3087177 RepID=UPI002E31E78D|nr:N-acetylmuramoyl-L-alanine amidase-like domain-containing protein [Francisella sp. 19X1-34]MED7788602.1 DUF1460 domain-containing protein [Francisella sp. 19X1-34]
MKKVIVLITIFFCISAFGYEKPELTIEGEDVYIPNYKSFFLGDHHVKIINGKLMGEIQQKSIRSLTSFWQQKVKPKNENQLISEEVAYFNKLGISYGGGIGEGWVDSLNIQQDLEFRLDKANCVTIVQYAMAIIFAEDQKNLYKSFFEAFNKGLNNIAYGAFSLKAGETYKNRNNFVSSDFNKVNNKLGYLKDVTTNLGLKYKRLPTKGYKIISHLGWFNKQKSDFSHIHILEKNLFNKNIIVEKFTSKEYGADFPDESIFMQYIPKDVFYTKQGNDYYANTNNIKKLMADNIPKIVEFVCDDNKWIIAGKPISTVIGSDILVFHLGILYNVTFNKGDVIYNQINCILNAGTRACKVVPIKCHKQTCKKVMLFMASKEYPKNYVLSKDKVNNFACTDPMKVPRGYIVERNTITNNALTCNRSLSMPFGDYFIHKMYNKYPYIDSQSILGINLQEITMYGRGS